LLKTVVFTISAGLAGFSGALYAHFSGFVSPPLFGLLFSTDVIIWVAVGGRGTLVGAVVGAVVVNILKAVVSDWLDVLWLLLVGVFFVVTVFFFPDGIVGSVGRLRWRTMLAVLPPYARVERKERVHARQTPPPA
jgi:urea transport system permease protein